MAVPDYQKLMEPLLRIASDGKEHSFGETVESLAKHFKLSEDERKELLPSGMQAKFENRLGWAITYLSKAGLLERTGRGRFRITEKGSKVLIRDPTEINTKFLRQFQEFTEFQKTSRPSIRKDEDAIDEDIEQTPYEALEASYQGLRRALAQELSIVRESVRRGSLKNWLLIYLWPSATADPGRMPGKRLAAVATME